MEKTFQLTGNDPAAAYTLRQWCKERINLGMNKKTDDLIIEARALADHFEKVAPPVPSPEVKVTGTATIGDEVTSVGDGFKVSGEAG